MAWERIIEPIAALLSIGCNRALQAGNDEPDAAAVFQHAHTFLKKPLQFIRVEVLEHVGGIDGVNGVRMKRKPVAHVQPKVNLAERIAVDVHEAGKVFWTATKMRMTGAVPRTRTDHISAQEIIRNRGLGNPPKHEVFIALVKQPILQ